MLAAHLSAFSQRRSAMIEQSYSVASMHRSWDSPTDTQLRYLSRHVHANSVSFASILVASCRS